MYLYKLEGGDLSSPMEFLVVLLLTCVAHRQVMADYQQNIIRLTNVDGTFIVVLLVVFFEVIIVSIYVLGELKETGRSLEPWVIFGVQMAFTLFYLMRDIMRIVKPMKLLVCSK